MLTTSIIRKQNIKALLRTVGDLNPKIKTNDGKNAENELVICEIFNEYNVNAVKNLAVNRY